MRDGKTYNLNLTTDQILRAQGADPEILRSRKPAIVAAAEEAIATGIPLLAPAIALSTFCVKSVHHNWIILDGDKKITSSLIAKELKNAHTVNIIVCTIGRAIEEKARELSENDPILSMAIDALGSVAVEQLMMEICRDQEIQAESRSEYVSQPLGPGLDGWSVIDGQPLLFSLLGDDTAGITLLDSKLMDPVKSTSFILGISKSPFRQGSTCDFCNLKDSCRYKGNHAHG